MEATSNPPKRALSQKTRAIVLLLFSVGAYIVLSDYRSFNNLQIRLTISSPSTEVIQFFWQIDEDGKKNLVNKTHSLRAGTHRYHFSIADPKDIRWFRLDPSTRSSSITIEELALGWEPDKELFFSGKELYRAIAPVQQSKKNLDDGKILIVSSGNDPILNIDISMLTRSFRYKLQAILLTITLLITGILLLLFQFINSRGFIDSSHTTYPTSYLQWMLWGVVCFSIAGYLVLTIPIDLSGGYLVLSFIHLSFIIAVLIFFPLFWLTTRRLSTPQLFVLPSRSAWLWFALPSFGIWLFYLSSFWPASMSPDSVDQWKQVLNGSYKDWHPAFHSMNMWLITRLAETPAIVAFVQIVALSFAIGWALSCLQRFGVSRTILWCTSILVALWPINGLMVITLWKDLAYSVVLLILAVFLLKIVMSRGAWFRSNINWLLLGAVLTLISLYRHNGIVPAILTILALFVFYTHYWKVITAASVLAIVLLIGIRGPLYDVLDVKRGNPISKVAQSFRKDFLVLWKDDTSLDSQISRHTESKQKRNNKKGDSEDSKVERYKQKTLDRIYSASRLWRVRPMSTFHKRIEFVNLWRDNSDGEPEIKYISSNKLNISQKSLTPSGRDFIFEVYSKTSSKDYFFWMWRPAVYLYLLASLIVIHSWRSKQRLYLVLLPAFANSLLLFLVVVHKSIFRYHYPIVILGIVFILPLLYLAVRGSILAPYSDNVTRTENYYTP